MLMTPKLLAESVRNALKTAGLSQYKVVQATGLSNATVGRLLRSGKVRMATALTVLQACGCDFAIVRSTEPPDPGSLSKGVGVGKSKESIPI